MRSNRFKHGLPLVLALLVSGCNPAGWLREHRGGLNLSRVPSPSASPSLSQDPSLYSSAAAARAKANGELLGEMLFVVLVRPPQDRAQFGTLLDSLNQGASLEGIYNGLTHSSEYRKLEAANPGSSRAALQVFSEILTDFARVLPAPTEFSAAAARPLALPVEIGPQNGVDEVAFKAPSAAASPTVLSPEARLAAYKARFKDSSIFTLKRLAGDESLKVLEHFRSDRGGLAQWYAKWVVALSRYGVDFGLSSRNMRAEKHHADWAAQADSDRLAWEVLNRVHRVLNDAQKKN